MSTTIRRQILIGALNILTGPEKWLKGRYKDGKGNFCLLGAIIKSSEQLGVYTETHEGKLEHTKVHLKSRYVLGYHIAEKLGHASIPSFNDAAETTFEDVQNVLQEVIQTVDA